MKFNFISAIVDVNMSSSWEREVFLQPWSVPVFIKIRESNIVIGSKLLFLFLSNIQIWLCFRIKYFKLQFCDTPKQRSYVYLLYLFCACFGHSVICEQYTELRNFKFRDRFSRVNTNVLTSTPLNRLSHVIKWLRLYNNKFVIIRMIGQMIDFCFIGQYIYTYYVYIASTNFNPI